MDRLKWLWNRLRLMSLEEVVSYRLPQQLQLRVLGRLQARRSFRGLRYNTEFSPPDYSHACSKTHFSKTGFHLTFQVFDCPVELNRVKEWRWDPFSGKCSPIQYYGSIRRQDFGLHGDVKYLSELSRFSFLPFMALKHTLTPEEGYGGNLKAILRDWSSQNPYLYSIHWTSGIEVAIRSVNLVFTYLVLRSSARTEPHILDDIEALLAKHYHFLKHHPSKYSSANNHLTAELMGLLLTSCVFRIDKRERSRWIREFYEQVENQINADGVHMELSTRYHAEVLEHFLLSVFALRASGEKVPRPIVERISGMGRFVEHCRSEGSLTSFGDDDEGSVIRPYFDKAFDYYGSLLKSLNHLTGSGYASDGASDIRNYLIFGLAFTDEAQPEAIPDTLFEDSGYCFMYDPGHKLKLSFDTGTIGDPVSAAHGHSDLLHFNLHLGGQPVIVDPGTFQYHEKDRFWRDYFRGISAHNCISVNRRHHALMNNRMSWLQRPDIRVTSFQSDTRGTRCKATHSAYEDIGVSVGREVYLNRADGRIEIIDLLDFAEPLDCTIQAYLHFHPGINLEKSGSTLWTIHGPGLKLLMDSELFADATCIRGDSEAPLGWYSPGFGRKEKSTTLCVEFKLANPATFKSIIQYQ